MLQDYQLNECQADALSVGSFHTHLNIPRLLSVEEKRFVPFSSTLKAHNPLSKNSNCPIYELYLTLNDHFWALVALCLATSSH
jgi:hypothetical protein